MSMTPISAARRGAEAARAYAAIVSRDPSRRLDAAAEMALRAHAETVLGSARYLPWLRVLAARHGTLLPGWLPESYLARVVLPVLQGGSGQRLGGPRTLARRLLATPLMPDRAQRIRGFWLDREGRPLADGQLEQTLFGRGAAVLLHRDQAPRGAALTLVERACFARETPAAAGDLTVMAPVRQDPGLTRLAGGGIALLRIVTLKPAGSAARLAGCLLRLPGPGEMLPRPGRELLLPVDPAGRIAGAGLAPDWTAVDPAGLAPAGFALAGAPAAIAACLALHDRVPQMSLASWDIAPAAKGAPHLLDWHGGSAGMTALQALAGPVFAGLGWEDLWRPAAPPQAVILPGPGHAAAPPAPPPVAESTPPAPVPAAGAQVIPIRPRRPVPGRSPRERPLRA